MPPTVLNTQGEWRSSSPASGLVATILTYPQLAPYPVSPTGGGLPTHRAVEGARDSTLRKRLSDVRTFSLAQFFFSQ